MKPSNFPFILIGIIIAIISIGVFIAFITFKIVIKGILLAFVIYACWRILKFLKYFK